jgi:hypothetical protein
MERYIPWMYGVNGAMSVLGSVLAAILLPNTNNLPAVPLRIQINTGIL